jgi:hypothetical protein
MVATLNSKL